ncbi:MAG: trehalose-6-phosphate synthase [Pseudonocardiales bacterium]
MPGTSQLLVASNRGPLSLSRGADGRNVIGHGGGGLVQGMSAAMRSVEGVWVCSALNEHERLVARRSAGRLAHAGGDDDLDVRMLPIDAGTFQRAYNGIANSTLWFVNHLLYDTPTKPVFDAGWRRQWRSYGDYNAAFADALDEEAAEGATVVVQDYHLVLTPRLLRERRPDLRIGHFTHTPWAPPEYFTMLPDDVAHAVLAGILGADHAGFLCDRWAEAFLACCSAVLGATVDGRTVRYEGRSTEVGVHGLGTDGESLRERAHRPDVETQMSLLQELAGGRRIIARVDRTELSKNIVRGLLAYRELLRSYPEWRDRVMHVAYAYPSRHDLPEYREYTASVQRLAREIDDEFGDGDWKPVHLTVTDDFAGSLAAFRLAEVLVVNPIRDGMNLVAKEGPVLSESGCALVLSREAGAADDLGADAFVINPYDVMQTATAIHAALSMPADDRLVRSRRLASAATALPPAAWFEEQLAALGHP